jgi:deazaflavin-dependent oxidoreductase (nitroreductase family)
MSFALRSIVVAYFALVFSRLPWLVRGVGPIFGRALRAGLPGGPNMLVTVRGRSSGVPRSFPAAVLPLGDRWYLQAAYGEVNWVRNLRASREAVLTSGRKEERVLARELAPDVAGAILHDAVARFPPSPFLRRLLGPTLRPPIAVLHYFGVRIDSDLESYVAEARRHPVFELTRRSA